MMGVRNLRHFGGWPRRARLSKFINRQAASLDDAPEGANKDGFAAAHGDDHPTAIGLPPLLVAASLANLGEAMLSQNPDDVFRAADRVALVHVSATSSTLAPAGRGSGAGSNQSSRASLTLRTASSSVSPAEAQPGSSGKKAAHPMRDSRIVGAADE